MRAFGDSGGNRFGRAVEAKAKWWGLRAKGEGGRGFTGERCEVFRVGKTETDPVGERRGGAKLPDSGRVQMWVVWGP